MAISKIKVGTTEHELQTTIDNVTGLQEALDAKQATITGGAITITSNNLAANKVLVSNSAGKVGVSSITYTELGYLDGVTSNIQTQLDSIAAAGSPYLKDCNMPENRIYASVTEDYATDPQDIASLACFHSTPYTDDSTDMTYGKIISAAPEAVLDWINPVGRYYSNSTNGEIFNGYSNNKASGNYSHAEGYSTTASGTYSHAEGYSTTASGMYSHAGGMGTIANKFQYVLGKYNTDTTAPTGVSDTTASAGVFIVGVGVNSISRSNGFRINPAGKPYALSTMASSGADYAEYFEWMDGNPTDEDRRGRFVTLDGNKIRYATSDDDYILGVVSSEPTVVGDIHSETWRDMYLRDVFGSRIQETVEVEESVDENGVAIPTHVEKRWVLNPDYNPEEKYISREERPEWDAIGIVGKLVVVDDGTCQVNGYCYPDVDGVATRSESKTAYRVIERLDDTHVRIFIK